MIKHTFPVYLINLEHDHERRESSIAQLLEFGITPNVITAVNGHQKDFPWHKYRHLSRGKWWNKNVFKPGAFACYLSHVKCWQKIAKGTAEYAMILEDDMIINKDAFQKFNIENNIDSFDIIFVNFGVTRMLKFTSFKEQIKENDFVSINELLINLLDNNKFNDDLTPGGYGYFVSKKGAIKLLQMMRREKICMGVDYAMIFNSLDDKSIEKIKKLKDIPNYLQNYIDNISDESFYSGNNRICLNSYVYTLPELVTHNDKGESSLKHEIQTSFIVFDEGNDDFLAKKKETLANLFGFNVHDVNYLVNISNKYKYIYFETPKVGCSTIKKTLQKLEVDDLSEIPKDVHEKKSSPLFSPLQLENFFTEYLNGEYFKFSFVRNPYTRILSCYLDKILGSQKEVILPQLGFKSTDQVSFEEFLLAVRNQSYTEMNVHWKPQSVLLAAENITLDFIGRQEDFSNDLKKVLAKITKQNADLLNISNERPHSVGADKKLQKYLNEDIVKLIQEIYHNDFQLYGYSKDPLYTYDPSSLSLNRVSTLDKSSLVSIVIPCYNQAQYLEESVESAINQTYPNIEIIIVNDGSPDNTQEIVLALQKRYPEKIKIIVQDNCGVAQARNRGIKQAHGQYIVPLDADDKLDRKMISHCMNMLIKNDVDIIYGDLKRFGDDHSIRPRSPFSENNILYESRHSVTSLYRKKVWEKVNGYKENMYEGFEDWEFWVNAYKNNFKFLYLSKILFYYRIKKVSRDTIAEKLTPYLHAKIVLNHPELYPMIRVEKAIATIKIAEKLSDLYFYHDKNILDNEDAWMIEIGNYLNSHPLKEKQILDIFDKKIGLCSLDILDENISTEAIYKEMDVDFLLFYASLRYETPLLRTSHYAWSQKNGIGKAGGNLFPYVDKAKREDPQLQHVAEERLLQYQDAQQAKEKYLKEKEVMKKKSHLVSIVIPCYNQAQYLEESVESAINQTYPNIEIIIVNDGSTDESEKVAKKLSLDYPDKNIQLLTQVNSGLSSARNFGIKGASGDFLFLLDADDILEKESVSKCMHTMIEHDADIVYGDYQCFGERNNLQKTRAKVDLYFIQYTNITGPAALYKRVVWEKTGGYKVNMGEGYEDWEFWVNVAKNSFRFHHIPEILFQYRVKRESMYVEATKKHTYLCSKVMMNNRELYTDEQQYHAVNSIRIFENVPTMYFYFNKSIFSKEKEIVSLIGKYIQDHDLYAKIQAHETCIIPSLADFGSISLSKLDKIQNKNILSTMNVDHHIFYEKLKYDTRGTDHSHTAISQFAWDKNEGCVPGEGTLFPLFLYKTPTLKIAAYKRSQRYEKERYQILETRLKEKENQIQNLESQLKSSPVNITSNEKPIQETSEKKIHLEEKRGKLVTLITRTKDRLLFMPRVFKTVVQQSYRPIEWVIVNDNGESIDELIETLKSQYEDQLDGIEMQLINKQESTGMEAASNTGLAHAHGHYIKFLDDDDTLDVACIAKQVYYMEHERLPNERGVVCYTQQYFEKIENNKIVPLSNTPLKISPKNINIADLARTNQFTVHSFLYEHDVLQHIGTYDETLPVLGDWEFNLRFIAKYDIGVLPEFLAKYHMRQEKNGAYANTTSTTHQRYEAVIRNRFTRNHKNFPALALLISNASILMGLHRKVDKVKHMIQTIN